MSTNRERSPILNWRKPEVHHRDTVSSLQWTEVSETGEVVITG